MPHIQTLLAHALASPDVETGGLSPAIHLSTTFERESDGSYPKGFYYAREGSPTRQQLEHALAALEGGTACCAFSSGMAAANAILQALPAEAHIVIPDDVYHGFRRLIREVYETKGLVVTAVDMSRPEIVEAAVQSNTKMIWVETPSNPMVKITDLKRLGGIAKSRGATYVVDGTWTTPVLQRPIEAGADLVIHSLTKYMAGHSDTLGGAIIASDSTLVFDAIQSIQKMAGAVLDPFSSWLTLRGLRSLGVRIAHQCANAGRVAEFLDQHSRVSRVHYPGLKSHPGHAVASSQMSDFGAMLSFEVAGSETEALEVAAKTQVFTRATSLGGTESLIEHRASMEGPNSQTPASLLRLSIGLEHASDLILDLDAALTKS